MQYKPFMLFSALLLTFNKILQIYFLPRTTLEFQKQDFSLLYVSCFEQNIIIVLLTMDTLKYATMCSTRELKVLYIPSKFNVGEE